MEEQAITDEVISEVVNAYSEHDAFTDLLDARRDLLITGKPAPNVVYMSKEFLRGTATLRM